MPSVALRKCCRRWGRLMRMVYNGPDGTSHPGPGGVYITGPLTVTFDQESTDIVISDSERRSFGKAARALASSAFLIGIMDHCFTKNLPHPGFVALDSPLTTKKEKGGDSLVDDQVSDEIIVAFFTHLATNYSDRQVIVIDNKEPPSSLRGRINHIRFDDDAAATRKGFFPG